MNYNNKKKYQAQILVIVLLVLSILGIFIVGIAANTRRDTQEQQRSEQYEQYYSLTEKRLLQIVQSVEATSSLSTLTSTFSGSCVSAVGSNKVTCEFNDKPETDSLEEAKIKLFVEDTNEVVNFPLSKDETFEIGLKSGTSNYTGRIDIGWNSTNVAWVLSIDYKDGATGQNKVIKDVYDKNNIYSPGVIQQHYVSFSANPLDKSGKPVPTTTNMSFLVSQISGLTAGSKINAIRIKPIIKGSETQVEINVRGGTGFPNQVRKVTGEGFSSITTSSGQDNPTGDDSPTAILEVQLPLHNPPASIFDYVLRSEEAITK